MDKKLHLLKVEHIGVLQLKRGRYIHYKVIRVEDDHVVYYTEMGMRRITYPTSIDEQKRARELMGLDEMQLIFMGLIAITHFSEIERVLS